MNADSIVSFVAGLSICFALLLIVSFPLAALLLVKSEKNKISEPKEEKIGKRILVPGEGVFTLHEKRKAHYIDEQKEWAKEQNEHTR